MYLYRQKSYYILFLATFFSRKMTIFLPEVQCPTLYDVIFIITGLKSTLCYAELEHF
jgi:hypothetical protein